MNNVFRDSVKRIKEKMLTESRLHGMNDEEFRERIKTYIAYETSGTILNAQDEYEISEAVYDYIRGLGQLGELLRDDSVTEIMANNYDTIYIEQGGEMIISGLSFDSVEDMERIMQKIAAEDGKEINQANPMADAVLADGSRVNMTFPPISIDGPTITIRKFPTDAMTIQKLISYGSISNEVAAFLGNLVRARYNILISGDNVIIGLSPSDFRKEGSHSGLVHFCLISQ